MGTVQEIERAILALGPKDLATLRDWFATFDAEVWDQELERDAATGKLDSLAQEALRDLSEGRCTDL
jgi:hypothetical protein